MITLQIQQTYAQIGIHTERPQLLLESTKPELTIHSEPAKVEISNGKAEISIDMTNFRASYGIKSQSDFSRDNAAAGQQALFEWIGKLAAEGERLGRIENGGNPIADMAKEAISKPLPDVTWSKLEKPEVRFQITPTRFSVTPHHVDISVKFGEIRNYSQSGSVEIYLAQKNSIAFSTTGTVDTQA